MADLFKEKADGWDASQMRTELSSAIGKAILEHIALNNEMHIMDFGAGTGLLTSHVAPRVKNIAAVDISASMLERLAAKPEFHGKVTAVCQDILSQPLASQFDLIVSAMAMHHIADTTKLFATFAQHLHPGGRLAIADLDKEDGSFHPADTEGVYHHGFERETLTDIAAATGFTDIKFYTAHSIDKENKKFPIFLLTATKTG